jgi:hypothetical protein
MAISAGGIGGIAGGTRWRDADAWARVAAWRGTARLACGAFSAPSAAAAAWLVRHAVGARRWRRVVAQNIDGTSCAAWWRRAAAATTVTWRRRSGTSTAGAASSGGVAKASINDCVKYLKKKWRNKLAASVAASESVK